MHFVVVGAGVAGLTTAKLILEKFCGAEVTVIERGHTGGGLLYGTEYAENNVYFDHGTHIFQETGISQLDKMMKSAIGSDNLLEYEYGYGDIAGAVYKGVLQKDSHFPDLRSDREFKKIFAEIKHLISQPTELVQIDRQRGMIEISESLFGTTATTSAIIPIMRNLYGGSPDDLSGLALQLPGLTRILLDDIDNWLREAEEIKYRHSVGVPDQLKLPERYRHGRKSFYSKKLGSRSVVNGLTAQLKKQGVKFHFSSELEISSLDPLRLIVNQMGSTYDISNCDELIITSGIISAALMTGLDIRSYGIAKPKPVRLIDLILDEIPTSELCFFYNYDGDAGWYRVTNYSAFSQMEDDRRLTVEVIGSDEINDVELVEEVLSHLKKVGFINKTSFEFCNVRNPTGGFPAPTISNSVALRQMNTDLRIQLPDYVSLFGIGTGDGVFFQNEILSSIYRALNPKAEPHFSD